MVYTKLVFSSAAAAGRRGETHLQGFLEKTTTTTEVFLRLLFFF